MDKKETGSERDQQAPLSPGHLPHLRTEGEEVSGLRNNDPITAQFSALVGKRGPMNIQLGPIGHRLHSQGRSNLHGQKLHAASAPSQVCREDVNVSSVLTMHRGHRKNKLPHSPAGNVQKEGTKYI